jgi:heme exporter protein C
MIPRSTFAGGESDGITRVLGLERIMQFHRLANPARFMRYSAVLLPWFGGIAAVLIVAGLYLALFVAPADYQQGEAVRIMYIHVPSAYMAMFAYGVVAGASAIALIWRHPLADIAAQSAAPLGAAFTLLCLVTGSLWGEPMWGTWWVWDARLTSVLILFFLYLGYIALVNAFDDPIRGARAGAVLALVGSVNVVIIHYSVEWWSTLHQPASILRMGGPTIDRSMLWPLFIMMIGFNLAFVAFLLIRMRTALIAAKIRALRLAEVERHARSIPMQQQTA